MSDQDKQAALRYNNSKVRRQDRLLEKAAAVDLLRTGEYGILSMVETRHEEKAGYAIPVNYVWDGENSIYIHCASDGYKLNCLKENPEVSFCVTGHTRVIPHKFTTEYESIIVRGRMNTELTSDECRNALMLILDKYTPLDKETGMAYIGKSLHRTNVIRLDIEEISGKTKQMQA